MWSEITYPFQTSTVALLDTLFNLSLYIGYDYLSTLELKFIGVKEMGGRSAGVCSITEVIATRNVNMTEVGAPLKIGLHYFRSGQS